MPCVPILFGSSGFCIISVDVGPCTPPKPANQSLWISAYFIQLPSCVSPQDRQGTLPAFICTAPVSPMLSAHTAADTQTPWGGWNGTRYWCSEDERHPKSLSRQSCFHLKSDDATWAELPANASAKSPASGMNSRLVHLFLAQPQASLRAFPTALSTSEMCHPFSAPPLQTSSLKWVRDVPDEMM